LLSSYESRYEHSVTWGGIRFGVLCWDLWEVKMELRT
jgi:hypothetical protein